MIGMVLVGFGSVLIGWLVASQFSKRWQGQWKSNLGCLLLSNAIALLASTAGAAILFALGLLELSASRTNLAVLLFNSGAVASWLSLFVIPIVTIAAIYEQSREYMQDIG